MTVITEVDMTIIPVVCVTIIPHVALAAIPDVMFRLTKSVLDKSQCYKGSRAQEYVAVAQLLFSTNVTVMWI